MNIEQTIAGMSIRQKIAQLTQTLIGSGKTQIRCEKV